MPDILLNKKIKYWEHQLLDLGKRNKMINYRETKRSTLKLIEPSFEELFQRLAINEETLTFQRAVDRETDVRVFSILSLLENLSSPLPVAIGDIKTKGSILDRQKTLKNIRSKARLSLEEQGTNILYLSFGFIEWRDGKGVSGKWIKSPLILVPAVLVLEALNSPYTLSKYEDDIVVNPTLQYYLKTEYGIELPNFDPDKDTLNEYLKNLEEIADQKGWRILKEVSLGLLSFLKISMYNDLIRNEERIKNNPVIRAMCGDTDAVNDISEKLYTFDLDSISPQECYQVMSADSSQQEAILYSKNNISFVMQGPPGTGKSQTITNIIAEALADGKKVLFVSEKMAALQVVYRRLQDAHLSEFCLPLHSHKANKKDILEQIGVNLRLKQTRVKDTALNNLEELLTIRKELNQYAVELHQLNPELNKSCYEIYSKLEDVNDASSITFAFMSPLDVTQAQLQTFLNMLKEYSLSIQRINCKIHNNPWEGLRSRTVGYEYSEMMHKKLSTLHDKVGAILDCVAEIRECSELQTMLTYELIPTMIETINLICELPKIPDSWLDVGKLPLLLSEAEELKTQYEKLFYMEKEITDIFSTDIYSYDYNNLRDRLLADVNGFTEMPLINGESADFFIENAISLQKLFSDIYSGLIQANDSIDSINMMLGINIVANAASQQQLATLLTLMKKNEIIVDKWLADDPVKIKGLIERARNKANSLIETKSCILADWKSDVLLLDYSQLIIYLQNILTRLHSALVQANKAVVEVNKLIGTNFVVNISNQKQISGLLSLIKNNDIIIERWFTDDLSKLKALIAEAKEKSIQLLEIKARILNDWENEILELEYAPILLRYKTEYTSFSKIFNRNYYSDKKTLQALSRTIIKKISDEIAFDLLSNLKTYHELNDWFVAKNDELVDGMSHYFKGFETDWDSVLSAIDVAEKLCLLPKSCATPVLIEQLSKDHTKTISILEVLLGSLTYALAEVQNVIQTYAIYDDIDLHDFDGVAFLKTTELYLDKLGLQYNLDISCGIPEQKYGSEKNQLRTLSKKEIKKVSDETVINLLIDLKKFHKLDNWFISQENLLIDMMGPYFRGSDSDWAAVISALDIAEQIYLLPKTCISSKLIEIMSKDHNDVTIAFEKLFNEAMAGFSQARTAVLTGRIDMDIDSTVFNTKEVLHVIETYIGRLNRVKDQYSKLMPFLIHKNTRFKTIKYTIEQLNAHKNLRENLDKGASKYKKHFGFFFEDRKTKWDSIISLLYQTNAIQQQKMYKVLKGIVNVDALQKWKIRRIAEVISNLYYESQASFEWISKQFLNDVFNADTKLINLSIKTRNCLESLNMLGGWIDYQEAKKDCCENGLTDFISKIEEAEIHEDIEKVFLKGFYHMWLEAVCEKLSSVRRFRRNTHDEHIKKFIELDDLQLLIAQMRIREKLIENLPADHQLLKATDEVAILKKELGKKRNIMPLRKLFKMIPNLLLKLKPCLMMSPLSVSYFLETEAYHFDLVIFDEASQIFPEDAIGAIFRGSQVVIAGDSKQLPPTNFFAATTNNFDGEYDINAEDDYSEVVSDSILEESASVLPNRTLLWHYRSKHESLIAFSNRKIYKNDLITFPSSIVKVPDMGVEYIYVENGYYEGKGKNCNIREAQKCVMLVLDHIQRHPDRSLGIIAFSEKQQTAIENAIIEFRERNPKYEWFFDEEKDEPFFVKNLENVQGDERDTIIFSICYAKDHNGKMYMRFGPLGHEGGERRLNVAITRAKCNVKLVGSILPSDIDLNRTNAEGVRMLRSYIEFARQGTGMLKPVEKKEMFETEDDFCKVIITFLEKHGYEVQTQIGCSDYKIDIAIVNPKAEGEFIAGIECDGFSYIHAKTARDRDHLRKTILQSMGWNLYRVWSTEWVRNPVAEGEALLNFIQSVVDQDGKVIHSVKNSNDDTATAPLDQIASEFEKPMQKQSSDNPYGFAYYKEAYWWDAPHSETDDNLTRISENIKYIVSVEQPIHMELLYKRMGPSFTTGKATEGVKNTIDEAITKRLNGQVKIDSDRFISLLPEIPIIARVPELYDTPRPMEYIHTKEIATAMIRIIECSFGITMEDLSTECAHAFGFERKGPKIKQKTDAAIDYLVKNGIVKFIDGKAQLVGGK